MHTLTKLIIMIIALASAVTAEAQTPDADDSDQLKIAALEALISAPPERALPIVSKVMRSNNSDAVKSRALFILGQIDEPEAFALLLDTANSGNDSLRLEAVRMIGVSGSHEAIARLGDIYRGGDPEMRRAVLSAYMIADDTQAVYEIAVNTNDDEEFQEAVNMLGAMGADEELRSLRSHAGMSETLINAYAIAGDVEILSELAADASNLGLQLQAIRALGIVGGDEINEALMKIYRDSDSEEIRQAALQGLLIGGHDEGVIELYRQSQDTAEKRELLRVMTTMGNDEVWHIIEETLENDDQ